MSGCGGLAFVCFSVTVFCVLVCLGSVSGTSCDLFKIGHDFAT